ncbi:CpaD family pilus assembly lipoprotein [Brevundimonas sp. 2R-24]|uniref:CpaD family pilus assembly lipoprotein n=1 Tax=Peiella sedimenti TaxID=3061083 RepID=A0ABT8SK78_9CAUL|nr:CpaD family pilus assembly lipoprotein [Caulobacteraceae bacterium XZ-24]
MTLRPLLLASALALPLGLAACTTPAGGAGPAPLTPLSRWVMQVEPGLDRIALAVHPQGAVSPAQQAALRDLAVRAQGGATGPIVVQAPAGADPDAQAHAWNVQAYLAGLGVNGVQVTAYTAPDPRAPVLAGFETVRAVRPDCSANYTNLTATRDNRSALNLGCSVNANLAAQIADPRDIQRPAAMAPGDAGRRAAVITAYRAGEATEAARNTLGAGRVSEAVQ